MSHILYRFIKRLFDIVSSLLAIIVSSPLWLIIAIGIKTSSKGPVLYRADRVGKDQKMFTLYKFRSMHQYHPEVKSQGEQREGGAIANTNRIFPFGGFLRKSKLDELPQLLNVFIGQMSVIGPRPTSALGAKNHYIGKYDNVLTVRPGLACLDSLYDYAHGELVVQDSDEYYQKVAPIRDYLASMYVDKMTVGLDIYCILRTIKLVVQIVVQKKKEFPLTKFEAEAEKIVFGTTAVK